MMRLLYLLKSIYCMCASIILLEDQVHVVDLANNFLLQIYFSQKLFIAR